MGFEFSPLQKRAIEKHGCDLLVSAAAGSGKTSVLVQRITEMIISKEKPISVDRLLVVTFTEASAREMKERLISSISKQAEEQGNDPWLKKQTMLVNSASISTIHSFCLSILRRYFYIIGLDPNFRTLDETEAELLLRTTCMTMFSDLHRLEYCHDVLKALSERDEKKLKRYYKDFLAETDDELFAALFHAENRNSKNYSDLDEYDIASIFNDLSKNGYIQGFHDLVEATCPGVKDDALAEIIVDLYRKLQAVSYPNEWIDKVKNLYGAENEQEILNSGWFRLMLDRCAADIEESIFMLEGASADRDVNEFYPKNAEICGNTAKALTELLPLIHSDYEKAGILLSANRTLSFRLSRKEAESNPALAAVNVLLDNCKKSVERNIKNAVDDVFSKKTSEILAEIIGCSSHILTITGLVKELGTRFSSAKREKNAVDFNDYEHFCLEILTSEQGADALQDLRDKYEEILIDEYQDTNYVQEEILYLISKEPCGQPNRFMVGDLKQSIYRFRQANPEIFQKKYLSYEAEDKGKYQKVMLSDNFRSRKNVIESINFVFRQIMSRELGDVEYNSDVELHYGASYYDKTEHICRHETELIIIDNNQSRGSNKEESGDSNEPVPDSSDTVIAELEKFELEAKIIASRIYELLGRKDGKALRVFDTETTTRDLKPLDIAVLMRSVKGSSEVLKRELRSLGIQSFSDDTSGNYFNETEIITILSYLQIIDNPNQDISLITVLYSEIYGLGADELAIIRKCSDSKYFYGALREYSQNGNNALATKVSRFIETLNSFRKRAETSPVSDIVRFILDETGFYDIAGLMQSGSIRQSNLTAFYEASLEYGKTDMTGFFGFVRYFDTLRKNSKLTSAIKTVTETDSVKIMTVHKSKGLEFSVVFVCGLGKRFNEADLRQKIMFHPDMGLAMDYVDTQKRVTAKTVIKEALKEKIRRENLSEEMRNLYVAMTRAKEKLILVGSCENITGGKPENAIIPCADGSNGSTLSPSLLVRKKSFMDWIVASVLRHKNSPFQLNFSAPADVYNCESSWKISIKSINDIVNGSVSEKSFFQGNEPAAECCSALYAEIKKQLDYRYPLSAYTLIPAKITISEIKRLNEKTDENSVRFYERSQNLTEFKKPKFVDGDKKLSAAQIGSAMHIFSEHLDFGLSYGYDDLAALRDELLKRGILTEEEARSLNLSKFKALLESELGQRLKNSSRVKKEQHFVIGIKPGEVSAEWNDIQDLLLVNGIIDCYFYEGNEIVLLDYKTDRVGQGGGLEIAERYRIQISIYKRALEETTGKTVKQALLYLYDTGEIIEM